MAWGIVIAAVGAAFTGVSTVDEMIQNRDILSTIRNNQKYLKEISTKIDVTIAQNRRILEKLDALPDKLGAIVNDVVQSRLLDERFSALKTVRTFFLAYDSGDDWEVSEVWINRIYESLQYISDHEQRISKLFQFPYWCDTALIYTRNSASGFVRILVSHKLDDLRLLESKLITVLEKPLSELEALLANRDYVASSNFSRDMQDISDLTYDMQPSRNRTVHWTTRECHNPIPDCCRDRTVCRDVTHSRVEPDEAYNNQLSAIQSRVEKLKTIIAENATHLGDVVGLIKQFEKYLEALGRDEISSEIELIVGLSEKELKSILLSDGEIPPILKPAIDCY